VGIQRFDAGAFVDDEFLRCATVGVVDLPHHLDGADAGQALKAAGFLDGGVLLKGPELSVNAPPLTLLNLDLELSNPGHAKPPRDCSRGGNHSSHTNRTAPPLAVRLLPAVRITKSDSDNNLILQCNIPGPRTSAGRNPGKEKRSSGHRRSVSA
jgi:hypothetical protein